MRWFGFEVAFGLLVICYAAQFGGLDLLQTDSYNACCEGASDNTTAVNTSTLVSPECFVVSNMRLQERVFFAALMFLLLSYIVASAYLVREAALPNYFSWAKTFWGKLKVFARPRGLAFVALLTMWMAAFAMAVAQSLSSAPCIADTDVWDTYVQYMGLNVFTTTATLLFLYYLLSIVWLAGTKTARNKRVVYSRDVTPYVDAILQSGRERDDEEIIGQDPQYKERPKKFTKIARAPVPPALLNEEDDEF